MSYDPVVVLNKNWQPVGITDVFGAINNVLEGRAKFLSIDDYITYDLEEWNIFSQDKITNIQPVRSEKLQLLPPKAIVLSQYDG